MGASLAWGASGCATTVQWTERRDGYPEGVASGDPRPDSVILWTRRPPSAGEHEIRLTLEVAEDQAFARVVATATATPTAETDWTCRVLAAGLQPARVYWYRFTDSSGAGSRVGRTVTAPADTDTRPIRFAFVSCQNANQGAQNAYRRMIFEDEQRPEAERLGFVLHLGDFVYELVWYPEERPKGMYDRRLRDIVRFKDGQKVQDFHVAVSLDDYRALYRAYLHDPDLQDARARWPFVCMWDNHEFSWRGWQAVAKFDGPLPAQTRKVAANQAWFEYQPARVIVAGGSGSGSGASASASASAGTGSANLDRFVAPKVVDAPVERYDDHGLGQEPNNLAAINSLKIYRALRYGRHVDLILTDNHSFAMEAALDTPSADPFNSRDFPYLFPEDVAHIYDAGRTWNGGKPPDTIRFGGADVPNGRKAHPPQSMLGVEQKAWFKERLRASTATWKVWGNSLGTLDWRADPKNLPAGLTKPWPGGGYACFGSGDWSGYVTERAEIFDLVRSAGITGFAIVAGDRRSFWAGLPSKALPPDSFEPVGVEFITGSVSAPGLPESAEHGLAKDHPLRALFLHEAAPGAPVQRTMNMLLKHGVRACLEYAKSGDLEKARALSNGDLSPHLSFVDMGGHGYTTVRISGDALEAEFVCIPRPLERSERPDGGPLLYRVIHRARLWDRTGVPALDQRIVEGTPPLST